MKRSINCLPLVTAGAVVLTLAGCGGGNSSPLPDEVEQTAADVTSGTGSSALRPDRIPLVVGGSVVNHKRYPWMAALVSASTSNAASGQFCGGSLIAERWVLTAAHCVEQETARSTDVLIGQLDLNKSDGTRIGASRIIIHPDYNTRGYPDLALIELETASQAPVIRLPSFNNPAPEDGEIATVIGWGQVSETGPYSDLLRETSLPIVDHNTCNRAYNGDIDQESMVCAGTNSGDKDSCYGDSGGPLFVKRNDDYVQAGVVSFGEECGLPGVPGVYARVSSYYDWISAYAPVTSFNASNVEQGANAGNDSNDNTEENNTGTDSTDENSADEDFVDEPFIDEDTYDESHGTDNSQSASDTQWSYQGRFNYAFEEIYLPNDTGSIAMDEGLLTVSLTTTSNEPVVVFIDQYDADYDMWFTIAGEISRRGEVVMELDIGAGEYGFSVLSLGRRGRFELDAVLQ